MKALTAVLFITVGFLSQLPCRAEEPGFRIDSPDHPALWYNPTGEKIGQQLRWSNSKNELILDVSYSRGEAVPSDWRDQTLVNTVSLFFPTIHLNRSANQLYFEDHGRELNIGTLESGIMGTRVRLDDDVKLSVHRTNGFVTAAISGR